MGLLTKASSKESSRELSTAGKALRDRLIRLGAKKSSAYTALSLLKGYGSFKIGACLELKADTYESYASVGLGVTKLRIPKDGLAGKEHSFFKISNPESYSFNFFTADMNLWMFVLDNSKPFHYLLLAVEESGSNFSPEAIALLISETNKVFFPTENCTEPPPEEFNLEVPEESLGEVRTKITAYHKNSANFQGILLEMPTVAPKGNDVPFTERVSVMAGTFGPIVALPSKRILVLLPPSLDRKIVAHRLSMSLGTETLVCFEADDPDKALELIRSYL